MAKRTQTRAPAGERTHQQSEQRDHHDPVGGRLAKPSRVIEAGIHDGIGSLVLLAALERTRGECAPGELVSTDVDDTAGRIVGQDTYYLLVAAHSVVCVRA